MSQFINLRNVFGAMLIAVATLGATQPASAGYDNYAPRHYSPACHYKTIIVYEFHKEKFVDWVIQVDEYGCEHKVPVVSYRTIKVPVKKVIKVCHD